MERNLEKFKLEREKALLLVVDVQQKLLPSMDPAIWERTKKRIDLLLEGAAELELPVLTTEQYPKGLGPTDPELAEPARTRVIEKMAFGCCGEPRFLEHLRGQERPQIIVTGMEAHVCVYQTVLGLLAGGWQVHLVRDAIISRRKDDYRNSLELARDAGAVVTTAETALFQMLHTAEAPQFKAISRLIKAG